MTPPIDRDTPRWAARQTQLLETMIDLLRESIRQTADLTTALSSAEILSRSRHEEVMSTFRRRRNDEPSQPIDLTEGVTVDLTSEGRKKLMRVVGYLLLVGAGVIGKWIHELAAHVR